MQSDRRHSIDTLAVHAGQEPDPISGAVMQPIVLASTFAQDGPGEHRGYDYSRSGNPTRNALERCIAALEGGTHGMAFASGCAAMTTLLHVLAPGEHVVAGDDLYGGSFRILDKVMKPLGVPTTQVDLGDLRAFEAALRPETKLVWLETPTNPMLKLVDIAAVSEIARRRGIPVVVDNTFATPCLQQPLALGATAVVHSTTKYLNGHSDVVGGAIVTSDEALAQRVRFLQNAMGAIPAPFDCYMVLRGLKTLHLRIERHTRTARAIASWLEAHPQVERVHYPGLASHPQHAIAERQMKGPGGMISFVVKGGLPAARALLGAVEIFVCAESLGGVESLIELPALMTHGSIPAEQRAALGIADGLIRISCGVEGEADLRGDLERALDAARRA